MANKWTRREFLKISGASAAALLFSTSLRRAWALQQTIFKYPSWMWEEGNVGLWHKARLAEFEAANPTFKVEATQIAAAEFEAKMVTQLAAGDAPDLMPAFTNMLPPLIAANQLDPLDEMLKTASYKDALLPSISVSQVDGKTYGIPLTMSPQSLLYNMELMEKAGVDKVPTTPEELFEAATKIKETTGEWGYAMPTKTSDVLLSYIVTMQWVIGFGSNWSQPDKTITANAPANKEALTWIQKFLDAELSPLGLDAPTVRNLFAEGKVGFLIDGPWVMTLVKGKDEALYKKVGYEISPTPTHAAITGGAFYVVPKGAAHKEAAYAYLEIINRPENQRAWLEDLVQIPGTSVQPSEQFLAENPWVAKMVEVAAKYPAGLGYAPPGYQVQAAQFRQIVIDHVAQIWAGSKSVNDALDECQIALEEWAKTLK